MQRSCGIIVRNQFLGLRDRTVEFGNSLVENQDMGAVIVLSLAALIARSLFIKFGFGGYGRAAFVALLLPYAVMATAAAVNNLVLTVL